MENLVEEKNTFKKDFFKTLEDRVKNFDYYVKGMSRDFAWKFFVFELLPLRRDLFVFEGSSEPEDAFYWTDNNHILYKLKTIDFEGSAVLEDEYEEYGKIMRKKMNNYAKTIYDTDLEKIFENF